MGYRSDVHLAVYAHNKEDFVAAFTRWRLDNGVDFTEWTGWDSIEIMDNEAVFGFVFYNRETKWYSGYQDVQEVEAVMKKLPEYGFCVEFVRIGEGNSDIDMHSGCPDGTYLEDVFWVRADVIENEVCTGDAVDHELGDKSWIANYVENQSTTGDQRSDTQPVSTVESEKHAV